MYKDAILDELGRLEREVVEGELPLSSRRDTIGHTHCPCRRADLRHAVRDVRAGGP